MHEQAASALNNSLARGASCCIGCARRMVPELQLLNSCNEGCEGMTHALGAHAGMEALLVA